jgi:dipeptidyl aminopeptidase/acylaminoacyl peptidase
MLQRTHFEGFRGKIETLSPIDQVKGVSDRVVVTMVVGTQDDVPPPSLSEQYRDAAVRAGKNVRLIELDRKDHEIALDPAVFDALLPMLR